MRLNKYIANSGICSRREADEFIQAGLVKVNDIIITELGTRVFQNDVVKFNDETIKGEEKVYIVMNKPKDFVTTTSDAHAEKTVMDLIAGKCRERVYPVGRLDKATTGVLLITNDGDLTERLTHPSFEKKSDIIRSASSRFRGGPKSILTGERRRIRTTTEVVSSPGLKSYCRLHSSTSMVESVLAVYPTCANVFMYSAMSSRFHPKLKTRPMPA